MGWLLFEVVEITNWGARMPQNRFGGRWLLFEELWTPSLLLGIKIVFETTEKRLFIVLIIFLNYRTLVLSFFLSLTKLPVYLFKKWQLFIFIRPPPSPHKYSVVKVDIGQTTFTKKGVFVFILPWNYKLYEKNYKSKKSFTLQNLKFIFISFLN